MNIKKIAIITLISGGLGLPVMTSNIALGHAATGTVKGGAKLISLQADAPRQSWKAIQVSADKSKNPYCSVEATFAKSGATLVLAQNKHGLNSLAIDFGQKIFKPGVNYDLAISTDIGLERRLPAKAVSPTVLVTQIGRDKPLMRAIGYNGMFEFGVADKIRAAFELKGASDAITRLERCLATLEDYVPPLADETYLREARATAVKKRMASDSTFVAQKKPASTSLPKHMTAPKTPAQQAGNIKISVTKVDAPLVYDVAPPITEEDSISQPDIIEKAKADISKKINELTTKKSGSVEPTLSVTKKNIKPKGTRITVSKVETAKPDMIKAIQNVGDVEGDAAKIAAEVTEDTVDKEATQKVVSLDDSKQLAQASAGTKTSKMDGATEDVLDETSKIQEKIQAKVADLVNETDSLIRSSEDVQMGGQIVATTSDDFEPVAKENSVTQDTLVANLLPQEEPVALGKELQKKQKAVEGNIAAHDARDKTSPASMPGSANVQDNESIVTALTGYGDMMPVPGEHIQMQAVHKSKPVSNVPPIDVSASSVEKMTTGSQDITAENSIVTAEFSAVPIQDNEGKKLRIFWEADRVDVTDPAAKNIIALANKTQPEGHNPPVDQERVVAMLAATPQGEPKTDLEIKDGLSPEYMMSSPINEDLAKTLASIETAAGDVGGAIPLPHKVDEKAGFMKTSAISSAQYETLLASRSHSSKSGNTSQKTSLNDALNQLIPTEYQIAFGNGINLKRNVSWTKGTSWQQSVRETIEPLGLEMIVNGQIVMLMKKAR